MRKEFVLPSLKVKTFSNVLVLDASSVSSNVEAAKAALNNSGNDITSIAEVSLLDA